MPRNRLPGQATGSNSACAAPASNPLRHWRTSTGASTPSSPKTNSWSWAPTNLSYIGCCYIGRCYIDGNEVRAVAAPPVSSHAGNRAQPKSRISMLDGARYWRRTSKDQHILFASARRLLAEYAFGWLPVPSGADLCEHAPGGQAAQPPDTMASDLCVQRVAL